MFKDVNFDAFIAPLTLAVKGAVEKFWEQDVDVRIQAINDFRELRDEKLIQNKDFFTSQIKIENHKPIYSRLDKNFVENFLNLSINDTFTSIKLSELTNLEVKILNTFCEFLYKKVSEVLIPTKNLKVTEKSDKNINILFNLVAKNKQNSIIMLTLPQDRLSLSPVKKQISFSDDDFMKSFVNVKIKIGSSKIALKDLQNLETDDIVLLENSDLTKSTLVSGDLIKPFNVKINPSLIVHLDDENEEETVQQNDYEVIMDKNLWDDIQVEINAEFEKVKMSIGELKQITSGQIVDLGSIFESEISLFVEDKKVAKGELLIINDRYAVKLNEVLSSQNSIPKKPQVQVNSQANPQTKPQVQAQAKPQAKPAPKPAPKPQQAQDEEFDYSDFEK